MQRNQRPPVGGGGGSLPPQWHPPNQVPRDVPPNGPAQNYSAHGAMHPHPSGRGGAGHAPPPSRNPPHNMAPPGNHGGPLLPLPLPPAAYVPGVQGPPVQGPVHHPETGGQNFVPPHYPPPQQQVSVGDLSAGVTLADLSPRVQALGFPASCSFVLGLLERYFISQLESGKDPHMLPPQQLAHSNIIGLINTFVTNPSPSPPGAGKSKERRPPLSAAAEIRLLLTIHSRLEEQENVELRYLMFDALFGGAPGENKDFDKSFEILCKLVSLGVTLESRAVLFCTAMWMEGHPIRGLSLAKSIFYEFCVLLPDALDPLLGLASHSPLFAQRMVAAFTTLHPFHVVGKLLPVVDTTQLHPPIRMLQVVLQWVESNPDLFCSPQHPDLLNLPLLHSEAKAISPTAGPLRSAIAGMIQWCILAPMVNQTHLYGAGESSSAKTNSAPTEATKSAAKTAKTGSNSTVSDSSNSVLVEGDFHSLMARLHAEVLSSLLSVSHTHSLTAQSRSGSSVPLSSLSSDDVTMVVAALLGFSRRADTMGGGAVRKGEGLKCERRKMEDLMVVEGGSGDGEMEESVERFAQFLQISMSTKTLQLKPEEVSSIASTLPRNRLLDLVISHSR